MASEAESEIRRILSDWAQAVREEDMAGVLAHHADEMLMFDVPPPFQSRGLEAYAATWKMFYGSQARPVDFSLDEVRITAGADVAFATAVGTCSPLEQGQRTEFKFRLTVGFENRGGRWLITHEHHSIPAEDTAEAQ